MQAIYYVSPKDHERKKTRPKGKLYARVQNRKEWMVEKGLMLEDELNEYKELEEQLGNFFDIIHRFFQIL